MTSPATTTTSARNGAVHRSWCVLLAAVSALAGCQSPPPARAPVAPQPSAIQQQRTTTSTVFESCVDCDRPTPKSRPLPPQAPRPAPVQAAEQLPVSPLLQPAAPSVEPSGPLTVEIALQFAHASDKPSAASLRALADWKAVLPMATAATVRGSADCSGNAKRNEALALARARAAARALDALQRRDMAQRPGLARGTALAPVVTVVATVAPVCERLAAALSASCRAAQRRATVSLTLTPMDPSQRAVALALVARHAQPNGGTSCTP